MEKAVAINNGDEEVRSILGEMGLLESSLYDYSETGDNIYDDKLRLGLTEDEVEDAINLKRFLRGVMLVTGDPGGGKGLFTNVLSWKIKRYFEGRKVLLDYKPKPLFGPYLPFDDRFIDAEFQKIADLSNVRGEIPKEIDRRDKKRIKGMHLLADTWLESKAGQVYLGNGVLVLEEFKRYLHNRRSMNPMGITLGHIITQWRHFDVLIVGMTPFRNEIDVKACLQYLTHEVRCSWQSDGTALCNIYQTQWIGSRGILRMEGRPVAVRVDGWRERAELNGQRYFDLYNSTFLPSMKPTGRLR